MNLNTIIVLSLLLSLGLSYGLSLLIVTLFLDDSAWKQIAQLVLAIFLLTTFYSSIKYIMIKFFHDEKK